MPALQVRDFPAELYEDLKLYAEQDHRSISQQVIVAVENMLRQASKEARVSCTHPFHMPLGFTQEAEQKEVRVKERKELFAAINSFSSQLPQDLPNPVQLLHEERVLRENQLLAATKLSQRKGK